MAGTPRCKCAEASVPAGHGPTQAVASLEYVPISCGPRPGSTSLDLEPSSHNSGCYRASVSESNSNFNDRPWLPEVLAKPLQEVSFIVYVGGRKQMMFSKNRCSFVQSTGLVHTWTPTGRKIRS